MFIFMFIIFIVSFLAIYYLFKKDIFAPAVIVSIMFCFSCLAALYNYSKWDLGEYNPKTVVIIMAGYITFIVQSIVIWLIGNKKSKKTNTNEEVKDTKLVKNKKIENKPEVTPIKSPKIFNYIFIGIIF